MCFNYYNLYIIFVHFMIMSYLIGNASQCIYLIVILLLNTYLNGLEMEELLRQSGKGSTGPIALIGLSDPSNL